RFSSLAQAPWECVRCDLIAAEHAVDLGGTLHKPVDEPASEALTITARTVAGNAQRDLATLIAHTVEITHTDRHRVPSPGTSTRKHCHGLDPAEKTRRPDGREQTDRALGTSNAPRQQFGPYSIELRLRDMR